MLLRQSGAYSEIRLGGGPVSGWGQHESGEVENIIKQLNYDNAASAARQISNSIRKFCKNFIVSKFFLLKIAPR